MSRLKEARRRCALPATSRSLAVGVAGFLFGAAVGAPIFQTGAALAQAPPPPVRTFEVRDTRLSEAAGALGRFLGRPVRLEIPAGHSAYRVMPVLRMPVSEPNDLLNAFAAAYGVRWVVGRSPRDVVLVEKTAYRGVPRGLRQALADALPEPLRAVTTVEWKTGIHQVEGVLKDLETRTADRLEKATSNGPVTLRELDPELAGPIALYSQLYAAFRLARACDRFQEEIVQSEAMRVHYGTNNRGTRQFSFQVGRRWIAVKPE